MQVERAVIRILGHTSIDGAAAIADRYLLEKEVESQVDGKTDQQADPVGKRTQRCSDACHQAPESLIEIPLAVETLSRADHAAGQISTLH